MMMFQPVNMTGLNAAPSSALNNSYTYESPAEVAGRAPKELAINQHMSETNRPRSGKGDKKAP